jgi:hypothetical protein
MEDCANIYLKGLEKKKADKNYSQIFYPSLKRIFKMFVICNYLLKSHVTTPLQKLLSFIVLQHRQQLVLPEVTL